MVAVNDLEKCLKDCSDYKELMTRLDSKNVQDVANGLVECINVLMSKRIYKNNFEGIYHCVKQLFFVLNGIINNEQYSVNLNQISNELTNILHEMDILTSQITSEKRLIFLKQLAEKVELSILLCNANEQNDEKYNFMYHLIFEYKDYEYLHYINESFPSFFITRRCNDDTLFETVLKRYIAEIQAVGYNGGVNREFLYYQKVLSLFIHNSLFDYKSDYIKVLLHSAKNKLKTNEQRYVLKQFTNAIFLNNAIRIPNIIYPNGLKHILKETKKDDTGRYDFTNLFTYSIDCPGTRIYDDAISTILLTNGNILVICHNADVIFNLNNSLDMKWLMDNNFRAPDNYSLQAKSSLNTGINKNTVSHLFEIDKQGNIVYFKAVKGIIFNQTKLVFSNVDRLISSSEKKGILVQNLLLLKNVYELIKNNYCNAIDNDEKKLLGSRIVTCLSSLTNSSVTNFFDINHLPYWYRIQKSLYLPNVHQYVNLDKEIVNNIIMRDGMLDREISINKQPKYSMKGIGCFESCSTVLSHVTSTIKNVDGRIEQALEHSMLIPDYIKDADVYLWEEYLKKREFELLNEEAESIQQKLKLR